MDLPTHFAFALAVGLVFFGSPGVALVIGLGALLPDLDREYWYVRPKKLGEEQKAYADEQVHRARFHNVFLLVPAFAVSPFLSLGVFLHMLQDSFTTAKDRGVEWFHPLTRLVKRGLRDPSGGPVPGDPKEQVYFLQEDPKGLVNAADPDLRETGPDPVPWRRVYGFAQNGHLLDRGFLVGSSMVLLGWFVRPLSPSNFVSLIEALGGGWVIVGFLGVGVLYAAGETDRRDVPARLPWLRPARWPMLVSGVALLVFWLILYWPQTYQNLGRVLGDPVGAVLYSSLAFAGVVVSVVLQVRRDRARGVPTVV